MKTIENLTHEERNEFIDLFYGNHRIMGNDSYDDDNACPWGCPWYHGTKYNLQAETVRELALLYVLEVYEEFNERFSDR